MSTKGPFLVVTAVRALGERVRRLLVTERFEVEVVEGEASAVELVRARSPTVVLLDWSFAADEAVRDLIHHLRPRRTGPRIVALARPAELIVAAEARGISAVVGTELDVEQLVDVVWRLHHEVDAARAGDGA